MEKIASLVQERENYATGQILPSLQRKYINESN
jgi:hypothetical protein